MKKLPVSIAEIAEAMDVRFDNTEHYLDLQTGQLVLIPSELLDRQEDDEDSSWMPDWEKERLPVIEEIEAGSDRYALLPEVLPSEAYDDMVRFAETVRDATLRRLLEVALTGRGAFRRFKNALQDHLSERERWFAFKNERMAERAREWLTEIGVEPVDAPIGPT